MKTKTFDCVQMKRRAAARIREATNGMTREEKLAYWQERNAQFLKRWPSRSSGALETADSE